MDKTIIISDTLDPLDVAFLEESLDAHAAKNGAPPYVKQDLAILHKNSDGKILAGLTGKTFWNWLYIDMLFVDESLRRQGWGAKLVAAAEEEARKRGCHSAYLWTENYEGLNFYPKCGYKEFVVKPDFPVGFTRTGFMKRIAA